MSKMDLTDARRPAVWGALSILIITLILSRVAFILFMPATYSIDLHSWLHVMDILEAGGNPYKETGVLNWPPFWMQILFGLHQIAKHTGLAPTHLIQSTLISTEALVLTVVYLFARRHFYSRHLFLVLLLGWALNPVCIFLSCQHCNYDVFVGLFVLLSVWMLVEWSVGKKAEAWLVACFCIGLGILAKTVPVVLTPLLLIGFRRLPISTKMFGAVLLAAPFTIGMSVLFTLAPRGVMDHVVGYRSLAGWYGITGLLNHAGWERAMDGYQKVSPMLFLILLGVLCSWSMKHNAASPKQVLILALLAMLFIPTFGPGYSPPYILWCLPLLLALFGNAGKGLQRLLVITWLVTIVTYTIEYAMFNSHGAFLVIWEPSVKMMSLSEEMGSRKGQTLIRLPMFISYVSLFILLIREMKYAGDHANEAAGFSSEKLSVRSR
jgi:hypothetical protein